MKKTKVGKRRGAVQKKRTEDKSGSEFQGYVSRTAMARLEAIRALISAGG